MSRHNKWALPAVCLIAAFLLINLGFYLWLAPGAGLVSSSLPFDATFDASAVTGWQSFGGDWQSSNRELLQQDVSQQYAAIFAPIKLPPQQTYHLQAKLQLPPQTSTGVQTSAGVIFNVLYPLFQWNSQFAFVRYNNGSLAVSCGYFWELVPHVQVDASLPSTPEIYLNVLVSPIGYTVYVNDQVVARDIPLFYRGGGIGVATLGGGAVFSSLRAEPWQQGQSVSLVPTVIPSEVPSIANLPVPTSSSATPDLSSFGALQTINGKWLQIGTQYRQEASDLIDYTASTGYSGERYTVAATIVLPQSGNAQSEAYWGGGFMLNMRDPASPFGANAVRLKNGGRTVIWGYFTDGEFISQGQQEVAPGADSTLKVAVQDGTYSIFVNNSQIAAGVPLLNRAGSLGLISDGGPLIFNDFTLTMGG